GELVFADSLRQTSLVGQRRAQIGANRRSLRVSLQEILVPGDCGTIVALLVQFNRVAESVLARRVLGHAPAQTQQRYRNPSPHGVTTPKRRNAAVSPVYSTLKAIFFSALAAPWVIPIPISYEPGTNLSAGRLAI